ncbi:MAG: alpha/beta hydrolase [Pseudomonadota bacterium]
MSVHPQIQAVMDKVAELGLPKMQTLSAEDGREQYLMMARARAGEVVEVGSVEVVQIPGPGGSFEARVYTPADAEGPLPLLVYYHGGGHVIGNPETHDPTTRNLCAGAACKVVSVNYRKGPEHKFPAAAEDAYAALRWCAENAAALGVDASRIAVGGDSAGGNLAAVTALMARDAGGPGLCFQLLVYPVADYHCASDSYVRYATGFGLLEAETMRWFQGHYLAEAADADDWRASPLLAPDLSGLPPALLMTAEYDVLHDEGEAFAAALKRAGVSVEHVDYPGMIHGFFTMIPIVDAAGEAQASAIAALKHAFGTRA